MVPELYTRIENEHGRFYYCGGGNYYPSVTTFLSYVFDNSGIESWRQAVGEREANKITKQSIDRGNELHHLCEMYLKGTPVETKYPMVKTMFSLMKPHLNKIDNIVGLEASMHSDRLRLAGTSDVVGSYEGIPSIIDFKNSNQQKTEEDILNYFIQATCYAIMTREIYGLNHRQIVILMATQGNRVFVYKQSIKKYLPIALMKIKQFYKENPNFKTLEF